MGTNQIATTALLASTTKWLTRLIATLLVLTTLFAVSITMLDDPFSIRLRKTTEHTLNHYTEQLTKKALQHKLSWVDKSVLHIGVIMGVAVSRFNYPEASTLLFHYVYGDGSDLELPATYFQKSPYLTEKIKMLGLGKHGPLSLYQQEDWRLALTLNPYYLDINIETIRLYHPNLSFNPIDSKIQAFTIIPIGKLHIKMYDSLVSTLDPNPFYAYSTWKNKN